MAQPGAGLHIRAMNASRLIRAALAAAALLGGVRQVEELARHHAAIDHNDCEGRGAVIENETAGVERVVCGAHLTVREQAVHGNRELLRRNVLRERPSFQFRRRKEGRGEERN